MTLGLSLSAFTALHTLISLIGIASGAVVVFGLLNNSRLNRWTAVFLTTSVLTDITGYMFPFEKLLPSHILGAISLVVLALAIYSRYVGRLQNSSRRTYAMTAVIGLYLNVFVLVVQGFDKVPSLKQLAPTQKEPPFAVAQLLVLIVFTVLGVMTAKRFNPLQSETVRQKKAAA